MAGAVSCSLSSGIDGASGAARSRWRCRLEVRSIGGDMLTWPLSRLVNPARHWYSPAMALEVGIVGLPMSGKAPFLTPDRGGALAANYPFATIEPTSRVAIG